MAQTTDDFPSDGLKYGAIAPWETVWAFIDNRSDAIVTVTNDAGQGFTIPPRAAIPWPTGGTRNVFVQSQSVSAGGTISVTLSDVELPPQSHPSTTVSAIINGNVNTNILNSTLNVTATIPGNVNVNVLNSVITANINNASIAVTDSLVETNTTVLAGVLPSVIVAFTLGVNGTKNQTVAKAIAGFAITLAPVDGFLSVWYTASGQDIYLTRNVPFYLSNNTFAPMEKLYTAPIPAGAVLHIGISQNAFNVTGVLKY